MVSGLNASSEGESESKEDEEDDLKEYLPEVDDEQTKRILEEGVLSHEHLHSQDEDVSSSCLTVFYPTVQPSNNRNGLCKHRRSSL